MTALPFDLVVAGASLGGLAALRSILAALPPSFPLPVAIVQHRRPGEDPTLGSLLARVSRLPVREPVDKEPIVAGTVYVAPPDYHLLVERGFFSLSTEGPVAHARPSIDVLFESAAEAYGRRLAGILLTASSDDGAAGIEAIARRGGFTAVEDPATAASPVAPQAALDRTDVRRVLELSQVGPFLAGLLGESDAPSQRG